MVLPEEKQPRPGGVAFDRHARTYDELHAENIKASGESTTYFAEYKLRCVERLGAREPILDFGCGIGNLTAQLVKTYRRVHAYDPSSESFLDDDNRGMFHNAGDYKTLYPEAVRTVPRYCAPRVEDGEIVEAVRRRITALMSPSTIEKRGTH